MNQNINTIAKLDTSTAASAFDPASWSIGLFGRHRKRRMLTSAWVMVDATLAAAAVILAYIMYHSWPMSMGTVNWHVGTLPQYMVRVVRTPEFVPYQWLLALTPLFTVASFALLRLYVIDLASIRPFADLGRVIRGVILSVTAMLLFAVLLSDRRGALAHITDEGLWYFCYLGLLILSGAILLHSGTKIGILVLQAFNVGRVRVAALASHDEAVPLDSLLSSPSSAYEYVGNIVLDNNHTDCGSLGTLEQLAAIINRHNIREIILFADPATLNTQQRLDVAQTCWRMAVDLKMVPPFHPYFQTQAEPVVLGDVTLLRVQRAGLYATTPQLLKRSMDLAVSVAGLIAFSPIMLVTAVLIRLDSYGPVFFQQERVGLNGRTFTMFKFRSMRTDASSSIHQEYLKKLIKGGEAQDFDGDGKAIYKIKDDPRITRVGHFIRKTSIDELPQLLNVLRGDMSLVGPRPPLQYEVDEYEDSHLRRLHIRPGITGLWQVSGRNWLSFEEMVQLDISYIDQWSLWLDLKIIVRTIPVIFRREQVY